MKKLAAFVEGLTEQEFLVRLLSEVLGWDRVIIWTLRLRSGELQPVRQPAIWEGLPYFAWVIDCGGEGSVGSAIRDRYESLLAANFSAILGLRDVYPLAREDIAQIRSDMAFGVPTEPIQPEIVLAIMEIEAWFIAEHSHFIRVYLALTPERIARETQFHPVTDDVETIRHPARLLHDIYQLEGTEYRKGEDAACAVASRLDYAELYSRIAPRYPVSLGRLVQLLDAFATPEG